MKRALFLTLTLFMAASFADDKPVPDHGEAVAHLSVPGMQCDGTCPPTVKAALQDGPGIKEVTVDYAKKLATIRFEADKTHATDALARLTRLKPYASSQLSSVEAVLDADYAHASATALVTKKGARAKVKLVLEPRAGHVWNSEKGAPDLEIELVSLPAGIKSKEPTTKVKGGLKAARTFDLDVEVDAKARSGEATIVVSVRLQDAQGKEVKDRALSLAVPVLVP